MSEEVKMVGIADLEKSIGLPLTASEVTALVRMGLFPLPEQLDPAGWTQARLSAWRRLTLAPPDGIAGRAHGAGEA
ncbi:hypothetical protein [Parvularcula maris]|uniref:Uncharacterized protein n=1 Tax=Parvularcula maris TaxID=2965077 RepID=A0A9X2RGE9_9PROT|nr:hypothetical protein [Parvularcula maris]MCQ8183945.1 hypothetical protein [Parvularcula maris]